MKIMSKLLIYAVCLAALLSCEDYGGVTVVNNSGQNLSFEYDGAMHTLNSGQTGIFEVAWYTPPPAKIKQIGGGTVKVKLTGHYTFVTADPIALLVVNNYPQKVILEAEDYIDADGNGNTSSTSITLDSGGQSASFTASPLPLHPAIYTGKPSFRVKDEASGQYINVPVDYYYYPGSTSQSGVAVAPFMRVFIGGSM
jgi:hypothetical protein